MPILGPDIIDPRQLYELRAAALAGGGMALAEATVAPTAESGHGGGLEFTPEWPRKTAKGKAATPLSAAARRWLRLDDTKVEGIEDEAERSPALDQDLE